MMMRKATFQSPSEKNFCFSKSQAELAGLLYNRKSSQRILNLTHFILNFTQFFVTKIIFQSKLEAKEIQAE